MEQDRKITVAEGVEDREALRASIAQKLAKPTVYRSIDIDISAEERATLSAADKILAEAEDLPVDLSQLAQQVASSLKKDPQAIHYHYDSEEDEDETRPQDESQTDAYKAMLKGMGFNL